MDYLAHLVELLIDLDFGPVQALLAQVDGVGKQRTALVDAVRVTALLQFDASGSEETFEVVEKLVLIEWFHNRSCFRQNLLKFVAVEQLQI